MKKKILISVAVIAVIAIAYLVYTVNQTSKLSPRGTSTHSFNDMDITVNYGRPSKKGRLIFGEEKDKALLPHGKYWRLGANDATEITFSKDFTFAGKPLKAGGYRMYCVPNATSWQITLNSELGKFGYFEPDHELDVVTVEVPVEVNPTEVELLTIEFSSDSSVASMNIMWDKTLVRVPITLQ